MIAAVAALTLALDQGSKVWALQALTPGTPRPLLGDWLQLNLVRNSGAAFSLGDQATGLLTVFAVVIVIGVLWVARTVPGPLWATTYGLLLGGAVGNLADRLFREPGPFRGHVVDFLDYGGFFVGNVADIAIVGAAGLLVLLTLPGSARSARPERAGASVEGERDE